MTWGRVLISFLYKPTKFQRRCSVWGTQVQAAAQRTAGTEVFGIASHPVLLKRSLPGSTGTFTPPSPQPLGGSGNSPLLILIVGVRKHLQLRTQSAYEAVLKGFGPMKTNKNTFDIKSLNYKCEGSYSEMLKGRMNRRMKFLRRPHRSQLLIQ